MYTLTPLAPVRQAFIEHLRKLLEGGAWDAGSPAGQQLAAVTELRVRDRSPAGHCMLRRLANAWADPWPVLYLADARRHEGWTCAG